MRQALFVSECIGQDGLEKSADDKSLEMIHVRFSKRTAINILQNLLNQLGLLDMDQFEKALEDKQYGVVFFGKLEMVNGNKEGDDDNNS